MFAAHLAAGLALKGGEPKAPTWALLTGAFLPDFAWIALARAGIEPTDAEVYFDGWSHSLLSVLVLATLFALLFRDVGTRARIALWIAVASHYLLDAPIHPAPIQLWPQSPIHSAWDLWAWGKNHSALGMTHYGLIQGSITLLLLVVYVVTTKKRQSPRSIAASCLIVVGLFLLL